MLGVPTVADRVAQTVVAKYLEPRVEQTFHPDSYGYRPGISALEAVGACRARCWKFDWIIDLDVQKFFDTVPWDLVARAVDAVTDARWVLLYVKRWLAAPLKHSDGVLVARDKGTPQGSAVSPVLANLFMHYAFDLWMARNFAGCPFERYADDAVVHCKTRRQAEVVLAAIAARMREVGLQLHPEKTRVVYCKDDKRKGKHEHTSFVFLGYAFRPRSARRKDGVQFTAFLPAISPDALKAKGAWLRELRVHQRTNLSLDDLARWLNPNRRRVDELLRPVLPVRATSPPAARQLLPEALGWEEIPATAGLQAVQTMVDGAARTSARPVRSMALGPRAIGSLMRRAR
jgi:group II intron reverse transcriptase/maturase